MSQDRFFIHEPFEKKTIRIQGDEFEHMKVMRIHITDTITLVNGQNQIAKAKVLTFTKSHADLNIFDLRKEKQSPHKNILALGLTKMNKLELAIEKGTELGIHAFWIFPCKFSEKKDLNANQIKRLEKITISALKQCDRLDLPEIIYFPSLKKIPEFQGNVYFGDLSKKTSFKIEKNKNRLFFIGCEKGFSEDEIIFLKAHFQAKGVCLSSYTLRAETAAITAAVHMRLSH